MDCDWTNRPYVIISSECHAGADLRDYKPYLERRWSRNPRTYSQEPRANPIGDADYEPARSVAGET